MPFRRYLAVIPARGGSKGVPRKNIRLVAGRPLIEYSISAALESESIDRCIVSTDDQEIAEISRAAGVEVVMRPEALSQDATPTLPVIQHVVHYLAENENYQREAVFTLQPTSPLRTARHIDEAAALFSADPNADSLVSCVEVPHIFHPNSIMDRDEAGYLRPYLAGGLILRRQEKRPVLARNGAAIYITRTARLDSYIFGGKLLPYMMSISDSVDIDSEEDLLTAERLILSRNSHGRH